jgi:O-antigen/teichoic acid export membrane protein
MSRLKTNFAYSVMAAAINAVVGLASIPFITRHVSSADFGHISLLLLFFYLFAVMDGIQPVIISYAHSCPHPRADLVKTCQVISWGIGGIASAITLGGLTWLYADTVSGTEMSLMTVCAMLYFPMTAEAAFLESKERVGFTAMIRSGGWAFVYGSFILYVICQSPFEFYAMSLAGMNGLLWLIYRRSNADEPRNGNLKQDILREMSFKIKEVLIFSLSFVLMNFSDRLFISKLLSLELLGYYSAQYELGTKGYIAAHTASKVLYPNFSRRLAREPLLPVLSDWTHMTKLIFFSVFSVTLLAFAFAEEIIRIYAGQGYAAHCYVFRIVMAGVAINSLGFMVIMFQRAAGDFSSQERAYVMGAVISILSVYPLVSRLGMSGAAMVYLCARTSDVLLILDMWKKFFRSEGRRIILFLWPVLFSLCYTLLYMRYYFLFGMIFFLFGGTLFNGKDFVFFKKILNPGSKFSYPEETCDDKRHDDP